MAKTKLAVAHDAQPPFATSASDAAPPHSPARHDLAELLLDLRDAERNALAARAPAARLEGEIAGETAAQALLDGLDADYAARVAAWATETPGGDGAAAEPAPPKPEGDARREAEAALAAAKYRATASRVALFNLRRTVADADARVGELRARIQPAVATVLREEGTWLAAEYWRRYTELEQVRRELTALDQVLIADFPIIHAPTGRTIVKWLSPVKLSAPDALDAAEAACVTLDDVAALTRVWRVKAEALAH
jgi:hypothetical protein